ncbi:MAG: hypothetical protein M3365_10410 [Gemmatimonadota bacterium]|nr:hypothetical protein [Gemmatimonadota bacterium]
MKWRPAFFAWSMLGLNLAGLLAVSYIANFIEGPSDLFNLITFAFFVLACAVLGALVAAKKPTNPIGWILLLVASFGTMAALVSAYIEAHPTTVGAPGSLADWVGSFIWTLTFAPMIFVIQLFPTGRPLARRWVPALWLTGAGIACAVVAYAFAPGSMTNSIDPALNPFGIESLRGQLRFLSGVGGALIVASVVLAVLSLILRFRRSVNVERQQMKWFAYAGMVVLGALVIQIVVFTIVPETDTAVDISNALFSLTITLIPITLGVAVLRYRLYDIDRIISRTLAYGLVSTILIGTYLLAVLALQSVFPLNDDSPVVVAASTLAVVAAFGPLRNRVRDFVDRRFNRSRYDAQRTIDDFGTRLRTEVEIESLTHDLVGVVGRTMQPVHVSLWLSRPGAKTSAGSSS